MFNQLCVWPGVTLEGASPKELVDFFENEMKVRIKFHAEVSTLPDLDSSGKPVPETGGRTDLLFFVHDEDVPGIAIPRLQMGIRWWEDVIKYNDNSHLYSEEFIKANPPKW